MAADLSSVLVVVPLKSFGAAKGRLASVLDGDRRQALGRRLAAGTLATVAAAGASPVVVTGDDGVRRWAEELEVTVIDEPHPGGLDAAAGAGHELARRQNRPWFILHADLPWLQPGELTAALEPTLAGRYVLCPSYDGGTSGLGGSGSMRFTYGPASFHRHLAAVASMPHTIIWRGGFALDVDAPDDYLRMHPSRKDL